jgi:ABC-type transport system involved in multi-copper enzyme maturation permease subunit
MKKCNYILCVFLAILVFWGLYTFTLYAFTAKYDGSEKYSTFIFILNNAMLFNKYAWTICGSVLISKLYSEEIKTRTTNILFTYPISRKKISLAKYIFVFQFVFFSFCISTILHGLLIVAANYAHPFISNTVDMSLFPEFIVSVVVNSLLSTCIVFITLIINVLTKSSKVTIISAIIIVVVIYQGTSATSFLGNEVYLFGIAAVIGLICSALGIKKIETMDL